MAFVDAGGMGAVGSATDNQTSLVLTTVAGAAISNLVVAIIGVDNRTPTSGASTDISAVSDSAGNTWVKAHEWSGGGSIQGTATVAIWYTQVTSTMPSGGTITATFTDSATSDASAISVRKFTVGAGKGIAIDGAPGGANGTNVDPASQDVTTNLVPHLRVRGIASEVGSSTALTPTAAWTVFASAQSATTGTTTEISVRGEFRIVTGSINVASNPTFVAADYASVYVCFKETTTAQANAWDANCWSGSGVNLSNGDKTLTNTGSATIRSTTKRLNGSAGKYYAELLITTIGGTIFGIANASTSLVQSGGMWNVTATTGNITVNSVGSGTLGAFANGDVICVAWDALNERAWFRKNGGLWNATASADPEVASTGKDCTFAASVVHALLFTTASTGEVVTLRTELADLTQTTFLPTGYTTWMNEALPLTTRSGTLAASETPDDATMSGTVAWITVADAWNANDKSANVTLSNSDKTAILSSSVTAGVRSSQSNLSGTAGKYYAEFVYGASSTNAGFGLRPASASLTTSGLGVITAQTSGNIFNGVSQVGSVGSALAAGDVLSMAWDAGTKTIWFRKNSGLWNNDAAANPAAGTNGLSSSNIANVAACLEIESATINSGGTVRTEAAELTQIPPGDFLSWMGEILPVVGTLAAIESGDGAALTGTVEWPEITGTMAASEAADDADVTGEVTEGTVTGTMAAIETGDDATFVQVVTRLVLTTTPGIERNDFPGWLGVRFTATADMTVNKIGLRCGTGNTGLHAMRLQSYPAQTVLRSANVDLTSGTIEQYYYADIAPITLVAGNGYAITTLVAQPTTEWWSNHGACTLRNSSGVMSVYENPPGNLTDGSPDGMFAGVDLIFLDPVGTVAGVEGPDDATMSGTVLWPDITGTLAAIEAGDTVSAGGAVAWLASLAATESGDSASLAGSVGLLGTLLATETADDATMSGTVAWQATLGATEAPDVASLTGLVLSIIIGPLAAIETADDATMAGGIYATATLAATETGDTAAFSGLAGAIGTLAVTETGDSASLTGQVAWLGSIAATEAADTAAFAGTLLATGTMAAIETGDDATIAGAVAWPESIGTLVVTEAADDATMAGGIIATAALAATELGDTFAAAGTVLSGLTGSLTSTEAADVAAIVALVTGVAGTLAASEATDTASGTGQVHWLAALTAIETGDSANFAATVRWLATLAGIENGDSASMSGVVQWFGTFAATEASDGAGFAGSVRWLATLAATEAGDSGDIAASVRWFGTMAVSETADDATFTGDVANVTEGLRPDADSATDGWTDEGGGTSNIWQSIDETAPSDLDYVQSPSIATASLTVRLFDGATEIAEWVHVDPPDDFVTVTQELTAPQIAAISSYYSLFVELDDGNSNVYRFPLSDPSGGTDEPVKLRYRYKKLSTLTPSISHGSELTAAMTGPTALGISSWEVMTVPGRGYWRGDIPSEFSLASDYVYNDTLSNKGGVVPSGGMTIDGYLVPAGVIVVQFRDFSAGDFAMTGAQNYLFRGCRFRGPSSAPGYFNCGVGHTGFLRLHYNDFGGLGSASGNFSEVPVKVANASGLVVYRNRFQFITTAIQPNLAVQTVDVVENFITDLTTFGTGSHLNGMTFNGGETNCRVLRNNIVIQSPDTSGREVNQTDCISFFQDFGEFSGSGTNPDGTSGYVIDSNYVGGTGYCFYGGQNAGAPATSVSNMKFTNNLVTTSIYTTGGFNGSMAAAPPWDVRGNTATNNKWADGASAGQLAFGPGAGRLRLGEDRNPMNQLVTAAMTNIG